MIVKMMCALTIKNYKESSISEIQDESLVVSVSNDEESLGVHLCIFIK